MTPFGNSMGFFKDMYRDMAIDVGTSNTVIFIAGAGIVLNEPSMIARDIGTGKVLAVGHEALALHEKIHPGVATIRPLVNGVIADYESTRDLVKGLIKKTKTHFGLGIRNLVISMPSGITAVEKRAVRYFAKNVGAKNIYMETDIMAAAFGLGIRIEEPIGNMIVSIGGGTTEIAVISLGGVVSSESLKLGGINMTNAILDHFRKAYNLVLSDLRAEEIKLELGSAFITSNERSMTVWGMNIETGLPASREISSETIREVLSPIINQIITGIKKSLEVLVIKPEIAIDIYKHGLYLVGGGALIPGFDKKITEETTIPVLLCEDPQTVIARGMGEILQNLKNHRDIYTN
jgi:rod shape-determining protein MreB and related proteins